MSTISIPRRPSLGDSRLAWTAATLLGAVLVGAFCGRVAVSHYGKVAIELLIGLPLLYAIAQRPVLAVLALLAVTASVFAYGQLPRVNLPGHPPINVADLCLLAAVGGTLWRRPWREWPDGVKRYLILLAVFLALAAVATAKTALTSSSGARDAFYEYRNFLYLATALTIALELTQDLWKPLLHVLMGFATVIAILSILAAASGGVAHAIASLSPNSIGSASASAAASGLSLGTTARVRLQGLYFVYAMSLPTLVMIIALRDRWRPVRVLCLLLMLGAIGLSLNRNMYAGAAVGLLVTALLGGARLRSRIVAIVGVTIVLAGLVVATAVTPAVTAQVGTRASSIFTPQKILQSGSFQDRQYELSFALPAIGRHPWFGVGPRQAYGALIGDTPRFFVQDLYLDIATDYGIPAAIAFLLAPAFLIWFGVKRLRFASNPFDRAMLAGTIGTLVALGLSLLVGTYLQDPESTVAAGVAYGLLLAAALRTYQTPNSEDTRADVRPS
jgi:hypothetical protein